MKLDPETIRHVEQALSMMEYGEIILVIHQGRIRRIDTKCRRRLDGKEVNEVDL